MKTKVGNLCKGKWRQESEDKVCMAIRDHTIHECFSCLAAMPAVDCSTKILLMQYTLLLLKPIMIGMCRHEQGYIKRCLIYCNKHVIDCKNYPYKQMEEEGVDWSNPLNSIWYLLNGCVWNKRTRRQAIFVTGTRRQGMTAGTTWFNAVAVKTNKVIFGR